MRLVGRLQSVLSVLPIVIHKMEFASAIVGQVRIVEIRPNLTVIRNLESVWDPVLRLIVRLSISTVERMANVLVLAWMKGRVLLRCQIVTHKPEYVFRPVKTTTIVRIRPFPIVVLTEYVLSPVAITATALI